jgi:hypothetical protein
LKQRLLAIVLATISLLGTACSTQTVTTEEAGGPRSTTGWGRGPATLIVVLDVKGNLAMGWGYYLTGTIQRVIQGDGSWKGQDISVSVYSFTFEALQGSAGNIETPLEMGFRENPDTSGGPPPEFADSQGRHWKLLYVRAIEAR